MNEVAEAVASSKSNEQPPHPSVWEDRARALGSRPWAVAHCLISLNGADWKWHFNGSPKALWKSLGKRGACGERIYLNEFLSGWSALVEAGLVQHGTRGWTCVVDPTKPPKTTGFIYIIQVRDDGPVKIGFSRDPERRLKSLQTSNPDPLSLLALFHGREEDEAALHREFALHRIRGEWFSPSPVIAWLDANYQEVAT